jgi:uncharacterized protein (DUF983 family)
VKELLRQLGRAVRLRCPRCGVSDLFFGWFRMRERCANCGLVYEREQGYFVGAIYLNYIAAVGTAVATVLLLDWTIGLSLRTQLVVGVAIVTLVPLVFFRYSRSLWLAVDHFLTPARRPAPERRR